MSLVRATVNWRKAMTLALALASVSIGVAILWHAPEVAVPLEDEQLPAIASKHLEESWSYPQDSGAPPPPEGRPGWRTNALENGVPPSLPQEAIDRWIELNHTNAESLLAARQTGGGQEYLLKALKLYPNDPSVLFSSMTLDDNAEAKRERLDRLKVSSPDNALAYYLSAREYLKRLEPDKAVTDLIAASARSQFEDYTLQAMQGAEELYLSAGMSSTEAKVYGGSSVLLPHLAQLKDFTVGIMDLRQQYLAAGDIQSADNLARHMLQLGDHLMNGDGSRFVINQLVGAAIQQVTLNRLDPNQPYDFLSAGIAERKGQLASFKEASKHDAKMIEQWFVMADEQLLLNYYERIKLYGERSAIEWWKAKQ